MENLEETKKKSFYSKFVNEENLAQIDNDKIRGRFYWRTFFFIVFSFLPGVCFNFIGFTFGDVFHIVMNIFIIIYGIIAFIILIKQYLMCKKHRIFRTNFKFWMIYLVGILCSIICALIAILSTEVEYISNETFDGFSVHINGLYVVFLVLPLFLFYFFFFYYTHMKCFALYAKKKNRNVEKNDNLDNNETK